MPLIDWTRPRRVALPEVTGKMMNDNRLSIRLTVDGVSEEISFENVQDLRLYLLEHYDAAEMAPLSGEACVRRHSAHLRQLSLAAEKLADAIEGTLPGTRERSLAA
jgi:hypothetical protein